VAFLDVDGPLIPFKARMGHPEPRLERGRAQPVDDGGNPLLDRLDPDDGRRLLALGCRLVWATTWGMEANEVISPRLRLPKLPVVEWPDDDDSPGHGCTGRQCFSPGAQPDVHSLNLGESLNLMARPRPSCSGVGDLVMRHHRCGSGVGIRRQRRRQ
jgi:hypothetical protein